MANEATPLAPALAQGYMSCLWYGPPGSGKTELELRYLAKRAKATGKRGLVIDVDQKLDQIRPNARVTEEVLSYIDFWAPKSKLTPTGIGIVRVPQYEGTGDKRKKVPGTEGYIPKDPRGYLEVVTFLNELAKKDPFPYSGVGLDSLTTLSEHLERLILFHHQQPLLSMQLWGVYKSNFIELVAGIRSLPCDTIFIAHEHEREDEDTHEHKVRPSIQGSYRDEIGKNFNEIYYFKGRSSDGQYRVTTRADFKYVARTSILDGKMEANVEDVLNAA